MKKIKRVWKSFTDFIEKQYGRKYYIVIARNRFSLHEYCVGHIFNTLDDAVNFKANLKYNTAAEMGLEVHSFRSKRILDTYLYGHE